MNTAEAYHLLGAKPGETKSSIKARYHRLMRCWHPDAAAALGTEVSGKVASELNEAYRILSSMTEETRKPVKRKKWGAAICPQAYSSRDIYEWSDIHEAYGIEQEPTAHGRYAWDPDLEEFSMFVRSVQRAAKETASTVEREFGLYDSVPEYLKEERASCQVKLFHLMAQEYILAEETIGKLCRIDHMEADGSICYRVPAYIRLADAEETRRWEQAVREDAGRGSSDFLLMSEHNRMTLKQPGTSAEWILSFKEDCMYYLVLPLLGNGGQRVSVRNTGGPATGRKPGRIQAATAEILLTAGETCHTFPDRHREIEYILEEYRRVCRKTGRTV